MGKISNISAADPPVLLGQFQHLVCTDQISLKSEILLVRTKIEWTYIDLRPALLDQRKEST